MGIRVHPAPYCEDCGSVMKLKRPQRGQDWEPFWGCGDYPQCKFTLEIGDDGLPVSRYEDMSWGDASDF